MGSLIAGAFGAVYVLVNTDHLADPLPVVLRAAAVAAFVAVVVAYFRNRDPRRVPVRDAAGQREVVRRFGTIVTVEAAAILAGTAVLARVLDLPEAGVAWVSVVVGLHFLPLARLFRIRALRPLGVLVTAAGATGMAVAVLGGPVAAVDVVAGVLPGWLLLAAAWRGARHDLVDRPDADPATTSTSTSTADEGDHHRVHIH